MKRWILLALLLVIALPSPAQYVNRKGTHLVRDGQKLSREEQAQLLADIDGNDYNPAWNRAAIWRNTGLGLTIGGGTLLGVGAGVTVFGVIVAAVGTAVGAAAGAVAGGSSGAQQGAQAGVKAGQPIITGGLITGAVGVVALGVGIPVLAVNGKKLNSIAKAYNQTQVPEEKPVEVAFGPAPSGIGITLTF